MPDPVMNMKALDWAILGTLIAFLVAMLVYSQRFVRNTSQFLAADRCAGRYLLAISNGIAALGAITVIAQFELNYQAGFSPVWWSFIMGFVSLALTASGWVSYRLRETRVLTIAQFFEERYSRKFRVFAGFMAWLAGVLNYGIFPAVSARFFIYFCGLPQQFGLFGFTVSTYVFLLLLFLSLGVIFAIFGGQVAIMVTDFCQGTFCNIAFLILLFYLLTVFDWRTIAATLTELSMKNPAGSLVDPFKTSSLRDFNLTYFLISVFFTVIYWQTWLGTQGFQVSAKSPHESKMAGMLGTWRGMTQSRLLLFIPICAIVVLQGNLPEFAAVRQQTETALAAVGNSTLHEQLQVSVVLAKLLPAGLLGMFAAMMFAAMLSTDDSYLHSWGSILIQDVLLPMRRKQTALSPRQHINLLRLSILLVAVIAFFISWLFQQTQSIMLYFTISGALYAASAVVIGGLYWKKGTTTAAWISMISGAAFAIAGLLLCYYTPEWWQSHSGGAPQFYPDGRRIPLLDGQQAGFWAAVISIVSYIVISLCERRLRRMPDFNLERMLHRGPYARPGEAKPATGLKAFGFTADFTRSDKFIYLITIGWNLLWFVIGVALLLLEKAGLMTAARWTGFWIWFMIIGVVIGVGTTVWFLIGGVSDMRELFHTLKTARSNDNDDGRVIDGRNAGDR